MRALIGCGLAVLLVAGVATAEDKIDAKKLVGKWEPKKLSKELPKGVTGTLEFTADGKTTFLFDAGGKEIKITGTYKLVGNKLTTKMTDPTGREKEDTATVLKLTADEFEVKDDKGDVDTFKKKK